jgi:hypothetical protein
VQLVGLQLRPTLKHACPCGQPVAMQPAGLGAAQEPDCEPPVARLPPECIPPPLAPPCPPKPGTPPVEFEPPDAVGSTLGIPLHAQFAKTTAAKPSNEYTPANRSIIERCVLAPELWLTIGHRSCQWYLVVTGASGPAAPGAGTRCRGPGGSPLATDQSLPSKIARANRAQKQLRQRGSNRGGSHGGSLRQQLRQRQ